VVAELCNVIAGNLKGLIQGEVTLSLPTAEEVGTGAAGSQTPPGSGAIAVDVALLFLGQPIAVRIFEYPAP
jgi:hypothetical protein